MDDELRYLERLSSLRYWLRRIPSSEITITHTRVAVDGLPEPELIEGHQPDLLARGPSGKLIIGLIHPGPDFSDDQSLERFRVLGNFIDPESDERAALNVAVPKDLRDPAEAGLRAAGLTPEEFNVLGLPR